MVKKCMIVDACQFTPSYNFSLIDALVKNGVKITYATTEFSYDKIPDPAGTDVLRCFFFLARLANRVGCPRRLRQALRAIEYPFNLAFLFGYILLHRIKLVHVMWVVAPTFDSVMIRLLRAVGIRVVYTAHDPLPHERKANHTKQYTRVYNAVDHIIVLTQYACDEIVDTCGISRQKISIVPHGDYDVLFAHFGRNDNLAAEVRRKANGGKVVSFLGNIEPYKGLEYFIAAFEAIKAKVPETVFLIAGKARPGQQLCIQNKLDASRVRDSIWSDIRFVPTEDWIAYVSSMDVLVQPYVTASQSGNTVMAYSAGVPVISTSVGGLGEMIVDDHTGYVIEPRDATAIAEAVVKCLKMENHERLSQNAKEAARGKYAWNRIAELTIGVYEKFSS